MQLPDDADVVEREIYHLLLTGLYEAHSDAYLYKEITDPVDKFLALWIFGLQKPQKEAAIAVGLSTGAVSIRINKVKQKLRQSFKSKLKPE